MSESESDLSPKRGTAAAAKKRTAKKTPEKKPVVKKKSAAAARTRSRESKAEPGNAPAPAVKKKAARKKTTGETSSRPPVIAPRQPESPVEPAGHPAALESTSVPASEPVTVSSGAAPAEEMSPGGEGSAASARPQGPEAPPRKLNKWERWKLRKEKFKQLRQQRYLEKQARLSGQPPGDNGAQPSVDQSRPQFHGPPRPEPLSGPPEPCSGLLEIQPGKGFGFLRPRERNFMALPTDPFVPPEMVRQMGLRDAVWIDGLMRQGVRGPQVVEITAVNGREPESYRALPIFEELTAINPNKRYVLETSHNRHTTRLIDFIAPVGRGQRGLIVAPPRAGKTTILQHIAEAILENYESTKVIVLLVDERPEEVTELVRTLPGAEVMASNNDQDPRNHLRIATLAIERAKRLVEAGEHVFMLLDSITRLARAFNNAIRGLGGGKGSLSGGVDARALENSRRLFAAARNTREAGSLTIVATALVETNSKADELIFQEFKGTGNMELVLDRRISQQYIYPAVDIFRSGTRREELLLPAHQMEKVHLIRRGLAGHKPVEAIERLLHFMNKFSTNAQMLVEIKSRE